MDTVRQLPTSRLIVESETEAETAAPTTQTPSEWDVVTKALGVLSKRVLAAMGHWIAFVIVVIAAALWWKVMSDPTTQQLIGLGLYAVFGLAVIISKGRS